MCSIEYDIDRRSNYPQLAVKLVANYILDRHNKEVPLDSIKILAFDYIFGGWKATLVCPAYYPDVHFLVKFDKHSFEVHIDTYVCASRHVQSCEINE